MRDFRNILGWQKASALEDRLEAIIQRLLDQRPSLADQIDRAVSSISANIAEGCGRESKGDYKRFLTQAIGSSTELENHLLKARRVGLLKEEECNDLIEATTEVRKILYGLRKAVG